MFFQFRKIFIKVCTEQICTIVFREEVQIILQSHQSKPLISARLWNTRQSHPYFPTYFNPRSIVLFCLKSNPYVETKDLLWNTISACQTRSL